MSSRSIELFRQHTEKQRQESQQPQRKRQARTPSGEPQKPSLVAEISGIEHEVRELFNDASPEDRDNIIRYLELLIRNLKRAGQ